MRNFVLCSLALGTLTLGLARLAAGGGAASKDIVDTAVAGKFATLVSAVKAAELVDTLKGQGPFTVFAPSDEAFAKLPPGTLDKLLNEPGRKTLKGILLYHVVPGKVMASDVVKLDSARSAGGQNIAIQVQDGKVMLNGRTMVTRADVMTSNGVIHVIDTVLLPGKN